MILELADGRKITLPDSWSDEEARELRDDFLAGRVADERLDELKTTAAYESAHPQIAMLMELRQIRRLLNADRVLVDGPVPRSRVVLRRS
jgi:hypothetical protein